MLHAYNIIYVISHVDSVIYLGGRTCGRTCGPLSGGRTRWPPAHMAKTALPSSPVSHTMTGCLPGRTLSRIQPWLVGRRLAEVHFHDVCVLPFLQLGHDVPVKCVCVGRERRDVESGLLPTFLCTLMKNSVKCWRS